MKAPFPVTAEEPKRSKVEAPCPPAGGDRGRRRKERKGEAPPVAGDQTPRPRTADGMALQSASGRLRLFPALSLSQRQAGVQRFGIVPSLRLAFTPAEREETT